MRFENESSDIASQNWKRYSATVFNQLTVKTSIKVLQRGKGNGAAISQCGYVMPHMLSFLDTENCLLPNRQNLLQVEWANLP